MGKPQDILLVAEQHLEQGAFDEGKACLNDLIQEHPNYGPAFNHLGWLSAQEGEPQQAEVHYKKAIELSPDFPSTYFNYLILLRNFRRFDEMEAVFKSALGVSTIRLDILNAEYGIGLEMAHRFKEAIDAYTEAVLNAFDLKAIESYRASISRCKLKNGFGTSSGEWKMSFTK